MATLMLSSIGSTVAGPLGAAIGGFVGQRIDQNLLAGSSRGGPRLGDLAVQSSSYGSIIPRIYGRMRVAGTLIWATEPRESAAAGGSGKGQTSGQPGYVASLAVALSSRQIIGVRRIWADGQLLRGAAGDFKVNTAFRLYMGDEDQAIDPLIASAEGLISTPAFRGIAYAVFEELDLSAFGNRVPLLTFEIVADDGLVDPNEVLADLSSGIAMFSRGAETSLVGYAAHGQNKTNACFHLAEALGADLLEADSSEHVASTGLVERPRSEELGCRGGESPAAPLERHDIAAAEVADGVSITFYDQARDYQLGVQQAGLGGPAKLMRRTEVPAVMDGAAAKALAETRLAREWLHRRRIRLRLPPWRLALKPGMSIELPMAAGSWTVEQVEIEGLVVVADLVRTEAKRIAAAEAESGRAMPQVDQPAKRTLLEVLELPATQFANGPELWIAAGGGQVPWRRTSIEVEAQGTSSYVSTALRPALIGVTQTVLREAGSSLLDLANTVDVRLHTGDGWLQSCSDEALVGGANMAVLGDEFIQFGVATPMGAGLFRLSRLLRGRRGTEWAAALHEPSERFVLVEANSLSKIELPLSALDSEISLHPEGPADDASSAIEHSVTGDAVRPPSPVHLRCHLTGGGSVTVTWVPRSRAGWAWLDGVETLSGERIERYRIRVQGSRNHFETIVDEPRCEISAGQISELGRLLQIEVEQLGDHRKSTVATLRLA